MREDSMPFSHRSDPVLGAALRQVLSAEDHAMFVARVTAALAVPHELHWDILASWARHGIAIACVAALSAGLLVGLVPPPMDLIASLVAPSARELMATEGPPDPSVILVPAEIR
jgi:hypothetical protein